MRSLWIRCLAALVSLALASWTVHAMGHGDTTLAEHCQGDVDHARTHGDRDHHGHADTPCCCDYVACASTAIVTSAIAIGSAVFSVVNYRPINDGTLTVGAARLDPGPPRTSALS